MENVAAIVVTYNRLPLLQECINSLREQSYRDLSIIVVNNGSTDNTCDWLESQTDLIVINQDNLGGAGGFYTGIKYACEMGYAYAWVMDDDVVVEYDALESLVNATKLVSGFICSRVIDVNGEHCNVPKISASKSGRTGELLWGAQLGSRLLRVDITSFVSVLIPTSLVYEIGLPYKEYFIWGDDTEYTSRISGRYPSYMAFDSVVVHKRKISSVLSIFTETEPNRLKNYYYAYRNRIHNQSGIWRKLGMFAYSMYEVFVLLLRGKFFAAIIAFRGILSSLYFRPNINYPNI